MSQTGPRCPQIIGINRAITDSRDGPRSAVIWFSAKSASYRTADQNLLLASRRYKSQWGVPSCSRFELSTVLTLQQLESKPSISRGRSSTPQWCAIYGAAEQNLTAQNDRRGTAPSSCA